MRGRGCSMPYNHYIGHHITWADEAENATEPAVHPMFDTDQAHGIFHPDP